MVTRCVLCVCVLCVCVRACVRVCVCVCVCVCHFVHMHMQNDSFNEGRELQRLHYLSTKLVENISVHVGLRTLMNCTRLIIIHNFMHEM